MSSSPATGRAGPVGSDAPTEILAAEVADPQFGWRSEPYAWWVVSLLAVAFALSIVDRTILVLFVEPVKHDLHITDTEFSLLIGTAFSLFYVLCGLPLGWLTDRVNRKAIASLSVVGWSLATIGCGWAGSAWQLFLGRIGVGVGEVGLAPSAMSLIVDYYPKQRVALPIGFLTLGSNLGTGLTMIFGGVLVGVALHAEAAHWPILSVFHGWQIVLMMLGAIGLVFSLLTLTIREPPRTGRMSEGRAPIKVLIAFVRRRAGFVVPIMLAMSLNYTAFYVFIIWLPAHFIRAAHMPAGRTGYAMGAAILIGVTAAVSSINGWVALMRRLKAKGGLVAIPLTATLCAVIPGLLTPLVTSIWLAMILLTLMTYFSLLAISVSATPLQTIAPNEVRGQLTSVQAVVISILSSMLGPLVVAALTDYVFHDPAKVGRSLAITSTVALLASAAFWHRARRAYIAILAEQDG